MTSCATMRRVYGRRAWNPSGANTDPRSAAGGYGGTMTTPSITSEMTVEDILVRHPAMLKAFADAGFRPLLNPILRRLFARATTLAGAARKKGWDDARLKDFVERLDQLEREAPRDARPYEVEPVSAGPPAERAAWGVFLDNRGLEPPQPMLRILGLLDTLAPGERLEAHNDRVPVMLLPRLEEGGWRYETAPQADGSCRVTIWRV